MCTEPALEQYRLPQIPFGTTARHSDAAFVQSARRSSLDPSQNLAAHAAQARAMRFQLLASQLGQLVPVGRGPTRISKANAGLGPKASRCLAVSYVRRAI
jgi:hypothetical protein